MRTTGTHKDLSVAHLLQSLTVVGDFEKKWVSFAVMLHAYLAQDKEDEVDI